MFWTQASPSSCYQIKKNLGLIPHFLGYSAESLLMGAELLLARSDSTLEPNYQCRAAAGTTFNLFGYDVDWTENRTHNIAVKKRERYSRGFANRQI